MKHVLRYLVVLMLIAYPSAGFLVLEQERADRQEKQCDSRKDLNALFDTFDHDAVQPSLGSSSAARKVHRSIVAFTSVNPYCEGR